MDIRHTHDRFARLRQNAAAVRSTSSPPEPSDAAGNRGARLPIVFFAVAALGTLLYFFVPGFRHSGPLYNVLGLMAAAAILVGVHRHRPQERVAWYCFAASQALFVIGDVFYYTYPKLTHHEAPFPSIGDVFYLAVYPIMVVGVARLIRARSRRRDRAGLIDTLIISTGVGVISWVYLMAPYTHQADSPLLAKATSLAYPLMDLLVLAAIARLVFGPGRREPAFHLLIVGAVALTATDAAYGFITLNGVYQTGSALDLGWLVYYFCLGGAALHPSMRALSDAAPDRPAPFTLVRRLAITAATLMAPLVLFIQEARNRPEENVVVLGASVALFLLAMARMSGIVKDHQSAERRERALRKAAAGLVSATTPDATYALALRAVAALAEGSVAVRVCILGAGRSFEIAASAPPVLDGEHRPTALSDDVYGELTRKEAAPVRRHAGLWDALGLPPEHEVALVSPLFVRDVLHGFLVVATGADRVHDLQVGIAAVASQVSLALDAIRLSGELHRQQHEARFRSLIQHASDVVVVMDIDSTITFLSPSAEQVFGYRAESLVGERILSIVHPEDQPTVIGVLAQLALRHFEKPPRVESRWRRADGSWAHTESLWTDLTGDVNVHGVVLNTRDITERKEAEEQLVHQAFHDSVTGLANRELFRNRVAHALDRHRRDGASLAVLFIDIDDFKTVNDSLGHAAGDRLLREVARRLTASARPADTVARLGGDEFGLLIEDGGEAESVGLADRVLEALSAPVIVDGKEVFPRASIGIAVSGPWGARASTDALLRDADVAMYMAKSNGKGRYELFQPVMHERVLQRLELHADLERATEKHEFVLHYQPVVNLATRRVTGFEALIRWQHPRRGLVAPDAFIPYAEETGLIVAMGRWALAEACRVGQQLHEDFPSDPPMTMAVNLSSRQLQHPDLLDHVCEALDNSGFDPKCLVIEITETVMIQDPSASAETLAAIKRLGIDLAIDDFGTGYSSLTYLRELPIDILKADKSFVDRMGDGPEEAAVAAAIMKLGGILNLRTVAEGIERPEQVDLLLGLGCGYGQGYWFSRPLDIVALRAFLASHLAEFGALAA